ncbi:MAG: hypothetical protein Q7J38_04075 [Gallionella sp.]|nr:hypothetical protein [Gallionella sp.]
MNLAIPAPDASQRRVMASHPIPPPHEAPLSNSLPQAGERTNVKGNFQFSGEGANESLREFHISGTDP